MNGPMHDIHIIRENRDAFDEGLRRRGLEPQAARLLALDERRRAAIAAAQAAKERRGKLSKEFGPIIGRLKRERPDLSGGSFTLDDIEAHGLQGYFGADRVGELKGIGDRIAAAERAEREAKEELDRELAQLPNTPNADVPEGRDEHDNVERSRFEGSRGRRESGRQHFELGEATGLMDFEAAARLSGSRFVVLRGQLARLERALGQFMLDLHTGEHGYTEVVPPLLVRDEAMFGTAQLPKFTDDQFATSKAEQLSGSYESVKLDLIASTSDPDDPTQADILAEIDRRLKVARSRLWLIPTAEVPLTNLVREQILPEDELPLRVTALTPCFRAEAGAAGRDTRGMLRQHQFTKCELVSITTPEASGDEHERMLACAEEVLRRLDIPYRVMTLCTGDMGFASAKTYDIEAWLPGQQAYREISSCSVCNDFQARRMNARTRPRGAKGTRFVHTLNGSGVAVGRALIAVMENYQEEDGSITVPSALLPYMGGVTRIEGAA